MRKALLAAILALVPVTAAPPGALAETGVYGRAAWRGEVVPGLSVTAYPVRGGQGPSGAPAAPPVLTATDGTYRLPLPPGQYLLVARTPREKDAPPRPGDHFCFYSGSPVMVREGETVPVGFNLVKVAPEQRSPSERSFLEGTVTYRDQSLEKLYLYLYADAADAFRGPALATVPVGSGGRFRLGVAPGRYYYLIARKRAQGGMYGPMEIGDHFNYYPGNPVRVGKGETVKVALETVTRLSQLEEEGGVRAPSLTGKVVDAAGRPVAGVRVFAYPEGGPAAAGDTGRPLAFSPPTGSDGAFSLLVPPGRYILEGREKFGGPAERGEWTGTASHGKGIPAGSSGVVITVGREP